MPGHVCCTVEQHEQQLSFPFFFSASVYTVRRQGCTGEYYHASKHGNNALAALLSLTFSICAFSHTTSVYTSTQKLGGTLFFQCRHSFLRGNGMKLQNV